MVDQGFILLLTKRISYPNYEDQLSMLRESVMNILFVEDYEAIQELIGMVLEDWGFDFDLAVNGGQAVELATCNEGKYDLCFMDTHMPRVDGFEAIRRIREKLNYIPILSASGNPHYRESALAAGADDFIGKTYDLDELHGKITKLTTKSIKIYMGHNTVFINKETPMNQEELKELIALKKKGLTKLKLVGTQHTFVVHKNIQNKISYDLVGDGKELSEFIDRSEKEPGRCHLYKANLHVTKDLFIPDELEEAIQKENEIAAKFKNAIDKKVQNTD